MAKAKTCPCSELPSSLDRDTKQLPLRGLEKLEQRTPVQLDPALGNWYLTHLMRCNTCQQLWQIDEATKSGFRQKAWTALFIKLGTSDGWKTFDDTSIRVNHLTEKHGGISERKCILAGCNGKAVNDGMFRSSCLYDRMLHM